MRISQPNYEKKCYWHRFEKAYVKFLPLSVQVEGAPK